MLAIVHVKNVDLHICAIIAKVTNTALLCARLPPMTVWLVEINCTSCVREQLCKLSPYTSFLSSFSLSRQTLSYVHGLWDPALPGFCPHGGEAAAGGALSSPQDEETGHHTTTSDL